MTKTNDLLKRVWAGFMFVCMSCAAVPVSAWNWGGDCCDDLGIDVSGEFLWWNVCHSDDLLIGVNDSTNTASQGGALAHITSGRVETFKFQYKPGFRVNLAYHLTCSDLSIGASYTYFHFHENKTVTAAPGGILWVSSFPRTPGLINAAATEARTTAKIKYDLIDIFAAKTTSCDGITSKWYGGVRCLIFDETFSGNYDFNEGIGLEPGTASWSGYMPAVGITGGYDGLYEFCRGWGIRGRLGISLLGGRAKHNQNWTFANRTTVVPAGTYVSGDSGRHNQFVWGWDAALGVNYDTCICCRPVNLAVGYEVYDWWNVPRQRYYPSNAYLGVATTDEGGHFTAHGAYVRLGTTF